VPRAETIRLLRSLDVPLREIAAILDSDDPDAARRLLEHQLDRVQRRIERERHTVLRLESAVARGGALGAYDCSLRDVPAQPVVAVRFTSPKEAVDDAFAEALDKLDSHVRRRGLATAGREIVVYDFDPLEQDDYVADVCIPLKSPAMSTAVVQAFELPACTAAVATHHGPDEDLQSAYCSLLGWILENGLRIAGHERERYLVDERDGDDPRDHVTEIMWPVERT
jgi:effector-binding domain-containing protein